MLNRSPRPFFPVLCPSHTRSPFLPKLLHLLSLPLSSSASYCAPWLLFSGTPSRLRPSVKSLSFAGAEATAVSLCVSLIVSSSPLKLRKRLQSSQELPDVSKVFKAAGPKILFGFLTQGLLSDLNWHFSIAPKNFTQKLWFWLELFLVKILVVK